MIGTPPRPTPVTRDLFGGLALSVSINATQARDTTANAMSDHANLFASYVQSDAVDPRPSADDIKNEVVYRNWLSRNLTTLTKNYIAHRLTHYLGTSDMTQAINDTITQYTTTYDQNIINTETNLVPNINNAVTRLRGCLPV